MAQKSLQFAKSGRRKHAAGVLFWLQKKNRGNFRYFSEAVSRLIIGTKYGIAPNHAI